ncbi:MAG TPA: PrgI family protein [Candidatus Saccharimonadales bacterium]|nr:PrgI family protein [Candidatus Saccharimonadales bacterium]
MAVYKVPQDVEADDKLIGPFSFRQFIYLIIVALSIALAWGLAQVFIPLAIIPLPFIVFFGAIALPLRKDQPMEIYMAAILSFYIKPRRRLWDSDGIESLIEITAPKTIDVQRTKDISQNEAQRRFSYLAEIVDSQGWAIRGPGVQAPNSAMRSDVYFEAQQTQDVLDSGNTVAQTLNYKLDQSDARRRQEMIDMVRGQASAPQQPTSAMFDYFSGTATSPGVALNPIAAEQLEYNPYPENMQQSVVQPIDPTEQVHKPSPTTSEKPVAAGILNLASNTDLSIEAIAREANRIQDKQDLSEEVVISLR